MRWFLRRRAKSRVGSLLLEELYKRGLALPEVAPDLLCRRWSFDVLVSRSGGAVADRRVACRDEAVTAAERASPDDRESLRLDGVGFRRHGVAECMR